MWMKGGCMIFFGHVLLGISLAAPIGPVNAAQLEKGLKHGFLHSWLVGLGAMLADALYMLAVYIGLSQLLMYEGVKVFLWLFGCFVLLYTGIETIVETAKSKNQLTYTRKKPSLFQSFGTGFLISISNPLTILFWLGIYGSVLAKTLTLYESSQIWLLSSAIFIGITLWDLFIAVVSSTAKSFVSEKTKQIISILSAISLISFGLYFGYLGLTLLLGS